MRGCHFNGAGSKAGIDSGISNDGDLSIQQRQGQAFADQLFVAGIFGINGHGGVAEQGLRTGSRDHDMAASAGERIADVPQLAGALLVLHLDIGQRGVVLGAPVDHARAFINQPLVEKAS